MEETPAQVDIFRSKYRELSITEKDAISVLKDTASKLYAIYEEGQNELGADGRKIALAKTKLEESVMWGVKAITG